MEPSPITPPPSVPQKKGLGTGAKVGIGCGGLVLLVIIAFVIMGLIAAPKLKQLAEDAQKNPTRTTASLMVSASGGAMEMVAEDDAKLRYTVKDKKSGALTTIYWNETKKSAEIVQGDFSAIPTSGAVSPLPAAPESDKP